MKISEIEAALRDAETGLIAGIREIETAGDMGAVPDGFYDAESAVTDALQWLRDLHSGIEDLL